MHFAYPPPPQEKGGLLSGVFRKKGAKSQSQVRWTVCQRPVLHYEKFNILSEQYFLANNVLEKSCLTYFDGNTGFHFDFNIVNARDGT